MPNATRHDALGLGAGEPVEPGVPNPQDRLENIVVLGLDVRAFRLEPRGERVVVGHGLGGSVLEHVGESELRREVEGGQAHDDGDLDLSGDALPHPHAVQLYVADGAGGSAAPGGGLVYVGDEEQRALERFPQLLFEKLKGIRGRRLDQVEPGILEVCVRPDGVPFVRSGGLHEVEHARGRCVAFVVAQVRHLLETAQQVCGDLSLRLGDRCLIRVLAACQLLGEVRKPHQRLVYALRMVVAAKLGEHLFVGRQKAQRMRIRPGNGLEVGLLSLGISGQHLDFRELWARQQEPQPAPQLVLQQVVGEAIDRGHDIGGMQHGDQAGPQDVEIGHIGDQPLVIRFLGLALVGVHEIELQASVLGERLRGQRRERVGRVVRERHADELGLRLPTIREVRVGLELQVEKRHGVFTRELTVGGEPREQVFVQDGGRVEQPPHHLDQAELSVRATSSLEIRLPDVFPEMMKLRAETSPLPAAIDGRERVQEREGELVRLLYPRVVHVRVLPLAPRGQDFRLEHPGCEVGMIFDPVQHGRGRIRDRLLDGREVRVRGIQEPEGPARRDGVVEGEVFAEEGTGLRLQPREARPPPSSGRGCPLAGSCRSRSRSA